MNKDTKNDLMVFIAAVQDLAISVSSFAGTDTVQGIMDAALKLQVSLAKDETIV